MVNGAGAGAGAIIFVRQASANLRRAEQLSHLFDRHNS